MKDLKTLKDIKCDDGFNYQFVNKGALRKEAIKWVKEFRKSELGETEFMQFFNLTEEDLK